MLVETICYNLGNNLINFKSNQGQCDSVSHSSGTGAALAHILQGNQH